MKFSFDCQKNLVFLKIPDQLAYYKRQFYVYNFTICQGLSRDPQSSQNTFIYTWTEIEGKKGSSEIASCVHEDLPTPFFLTASTL